MFLLSSPLQPLPYNFPSDNTEEIFKPGTIVGMVDSDDSILGIGQEPYLFACDILASGKIIVDPGVLQCLPNSVDLLLL